MYNAMAQAFINAGFTANHRGRFKAGWNASLSFRTHKQLQSEGYEKFSG